MVNMYWNRNSSLSTSLFKRGCQRSGHHSQHSLHSEVSEEFMEYSLWVFCTYPRDTLWQTKKFFTTDNFSLAKWIPKVIFISERFLGSIISSIWNADGKVPKMLIYKDFPMKGKQCRSWKGETSNYFSFSSRYHKIFFKQSHHVNNCKKCLFSSYIREWSEFSHCYLGTTSTASKK